MIYHHTVLSGNESRRPYDTLTDGANHPAKQGIFIFKMINLTF